MKDTVPHLRQSPRLHPELQVRQVLTKQKGNAVTENEKEVLITRRSTRISKQLQSREVNLQRRQNASNSMTETKMEAHPKRRRDAYDKKKTRGSDCSTNSPVQCQKLEDIERSKKLPLEVDELLELHAEDREKNVKTRSNDGQKAGASSVQGQKLEDIGTDIERSKKRPLEVDKLLELHAEDREKNVRTRSNNGQKAGASSVQCQKLEDICTDIEISKKCPLEVDELLELHAEDREKGVKTGSNDSQKAGASSENKKKIALDAIDYIQDKLEVIRGEEYRECDRVKRIFVKNACEERQLVIEQKCNTDTRRLYLERDEIVKAIPNFWLFAFLSHHCLGDLFGEEDQKIFRFVYSMDVKDEDDVVSGYTITLKFNDNPYFTNRNLTKRITFCKDGTTNLSDVKIDWNDGMPVAITTDYSHDMPDRDTGFFTWFCAPQVIREQYHDEVSELIKDELWPNALEYFVNGNENGEEDEIPTRRLGVTQKGCRGTRQLASI